MKQPYRIDKELFSDALLAEFENKADLGSQVDWNDIINKPRLADDHWKAPVATFADLPMEGNEEEDIRLVLDNSNVYTWNAGVWELIGANDTSVDWAHIQNKPATYPPDPHVHPTYVHDQIVAAAVWTITHNLNKHPSVTVVDSAGSVVVGDVSYPSSNQVRLTFSSEFSGKAYLN